MKYYLNNCCNAYKEDNLVKRICPFLFCIMLTITSIPMDVFAKNSDKASVMRIEEAVGTVKINSSNASAGMQLYSGDTVSTESSSYSHISLDSSKLVKLSAKSQASISKAGKKLEIALVSGEIFFDVKKKLSGDESMTMKAGSVAMSVRGTSGILRIENNGIRMSVYDGVVDISSPSGDFTMWGGETVSFNSDGSVNNRDLVDVKRLSEFEDMVLSTDPDVTSRASANINVSLPMARYNERSSGHNVEENIQQIVAPVVEPKPVEQPVQPVAPKPEEKKQPVPMPQNSSSDSHHSSGGSSSDSGHSGGGSSSDNGSSGGGSSDDNDKPSGGDTPTEPTKPDQDTCDHSYEYTNKVSDGHTRTCTKCGKSELVSHELTYSQMENYPALHLATCSLCGYDSGEEHNFSITGHFDINGNTTEDKYEYYTKKCVCGKVDKNSKGEPEDSTDPTNPETCEHSYRYQSEGSEHAKICTKCGKTEIENHTYSYTYSNSKHTGICDKCGDDVTEEHNYNVTGYFDIDGKPIEDRSVYYTRKCVCNYVDSSSKHDDSYSEPCLHHNMKYQNEGAYHLAICTECGEQKQEEHSLDYAFIVDGIGNLHKEKCLKCDYDVNVNHTFDVEGHFDRNGLNTDNQQEYYTLKCICGTVKESSKVGKVASGRYAYSNLAEHEFTDENGAVSYEEHQWLDKMQSNSHSYCYNCGFEAFKHNFIMDLHSIEGWSVDDESQAFYYQWCSTSGCGALTDLVISAYEDLSCSHEYVYLPEAGKNYCNNICKKCHYLEFTKSHEYIEGRYDYVDYGDKERYFTLKCKNCGYIKPESVITIVY